MRTIKLTEFSIIFIIILGINLFPSSSLLAQNKTDVADSLALVALYDSTDGNNWTNNTNWLATPVYYWYGVTVISQQVTELQLSNNNLNGTIPPEIGNLSNLEILRLDYNQLSGSIPAELTDPSNLIIIRLNNNQITGTFPEDCDALLNLEYLDLSSNQLADSIPSDLGYLVNLDTLFLDNNQLFGSIPSSLGKLNNLRHLWLNDNQLTDSIPKALGQLTNLTSLWLHNNRLSGSIPDTLKNLTSLESLYLSSNQLTDSIPSSLTNLASLQDELSDFRWNGLYTVNSTLVSFLNNKQWGNDWESTQTIAPQNMSSSSATDTSITLTWTPITFTDYTGGYRIYRSTIAGGPYTECGMTANKTINSLKISGLAPDITYYFVIRTQTDPHANNSNTIVSNPSSEISAATTPPLNPEMDVQGNYTSIADNDGTPDPADGTDFGNIAVDDDNKSQTFTIQNTGMIDLNLTGNPKVQITGAQASDFTVVSQPSSPVAAEGGTTTFIIQFDPSAFGIRNATVTIDNNDSDEDPYNFNIRGTGEWPDMDVLGNGNVISDNDFVPEPESSLNADSTDFGNVAVVGETVSHTFTIENNGNANLVLTGNPKVTVNSTVFTISSQPSSPITPGESTTFTIKFNPDITTIGDTIVTVSIDNNSSENPYDFAIQGTGTAPNIIISGNSTTISNGDSLASPIDNTEFGITPVAGGTISHTFTIENTGNADLLLTGTPKVMVTGSDFQVTSQPNSPVAPGGGSTNFTLQFDPSIPGIQIDTVVILNNDLINNYYYFAIQGTGTAPEMDVQCNSTSIPDNSYPPHPANGTDFGYLILGNDTTYHTFTIRNSGYADLQLTGTPKVVISGNDKTDFTITSQPNSLITSEGGTTSFTIQFTPSETGIRQAEIGIANTDIDENPYNFYIQGTGITPEINVRGNGIPITNGDDVPTSADNTNFGNIAVASGTVSHTFIIENSGSADLYLTNSPPVEITGTHQSDFTITSQPDTLITPGSNSSFTVEFDPSGSGIRAAILNITNNDIDENPYYFTIQGTGIANEPEIVVMGNGIIISDGDSSPDLYDDTDYGYISVTTGSVSHTFTIINQGGSELILTGTPAVDITGPAQSDFTVTSQPTSPIASQGGSTTFTIQFDPSQSGVRNADVSIASNDNDENPYNFSLQGTGIVIASQQDSLALVALYNSTNGEEWTYNYNWLETPVQFWYGVTKNEDVVTAVELSFNNLTGTIPSEIENLSYLITLDLQLNQLTGSIPSEIGNLSNLTYLYLNNNQLNGSLPPELGNLSHLEYLYLNNNQFSGSIPAQIGNLTNLVKLDLQNSNLTNSIPSELEYLTDLEYLWLNNNHLSGSIPPEMGNLPNLKYLSLNSNYLIGTIPESISDLTNLTNDKSDFRWNSLHTDDEDVRSFLNEKQRGGDWESTQTIAPDNIFCESVTDTSLILRWSLIPYTNNRGGYKIYYAKTTGGPYTEYGMTADKTLDSLIIKELTPEIPYYFVLRTQTDPHPNNNNTVLSEQSQEISCTTLQYQDSLILVALYDSTDGDNWTNNANWLSQPVETWYGVTVSNKHVTVLELNDNNLTGTFPQEMENLDKLKKLTLNGNRLTGSIPTNLINLTNLINDSCDFRWNGLYTNNNKLLTFLNEKQEGNDWKSTQTITPDNVFCGSETSTSIEITWTLISYKEDAGGYRVFYSTTSGGPYTEFGITANKTVNSLVVTGLNPETKYYFIVRAETAPHSHNNYTVVSNESEEVSSTTLQSPSLVSENEVGIPQTYILKQNHPNPFNPQTEITYALPKPGHVTIIIYNLIGQPIRTLIDKKMPAGYHTVVWRGYNDADQPVPTGIYFYSLQSGSFKQIKKALLMK